MAWIYKYGGQGGNAPPFSNQHLSCPNRAKSSIDIVETSNGVPNKIAVDEAALWLAANYDAVAGNPLLELMARFSISILEAVAASKQAHALRYRRAVQ